MSLETAQKFKKALIIIFLIIVAAAFLFAAMVSFSSIRRKTSGIAVSDGFAGNSYAPSSLSLPYASRGGINGYVTEKAVMTPSPGQYPSEEGAVPQAAVVDSADSIIVERKLMQDGNLYLVVTKVEKSVEALSEVAVNLGGRVDSVDYQNVEGYDKKRATVVLRVPAANFAEAMKQAKALALNVTSENKSTRDVTEQFVDMQARLKTLKATEEQYLQVMQKAQKIDDILTVERYLSDVRTQIEQLQGQMNYLSRQVDMSIITIILSSEPEINPGSVVWNPGTIAKDSMRDFVRMFYSFIDAVIRLVLFYLPMLIILGGLIFLAFLFFVKVLRPWYEASKDLFHF